MAPAQGGDDLESKRCPRVRCVAIPYTCGEQALLDRSLGIVDSTVMGAGGVTDQVTTKPSKLSRCTISAMARSISCLAALHSQLRYMTFSDLIAPSIPTTTDSAFTGFENRLNKASNPRTLVTLDNALEMIV
jgi:hypothetical protein